MRFTVGHLIMLIVVVGAVILVFRPVTGVDRASVTVRDGGEVQAFDPTVADSLYEQYRGLGGREKIPEDGMLFRFLVEREHTIVMRGMEASIDVVFINSEGEVVAVEHGTPPGNDSAQTSFSHRSKYVWELPDGSAEEYGIEVGDTVQISLSDGAAEGRKAEA